MIQGGDIMNGDGTGRVSIYGKTFPDENFRIKHDKPYFLSMANSGPNSNGCQFFITCVPCPHLDEKHVVFGRLITGQKIIARIENASVDNKSKPLVDVLITNCGEFKPEEKAKKKSEEEVEQENKEGAASTMKASDIPDFPAERNFLYRHSKTPERKPKDDEKDGKEKKKKRANSRERRDRHRDRSRSRDRRNRSRSRDRRDDRRDSRRRSSRSRSPWRSHRSGGRGDRGQVKGRGPIMLFSALRGEEPLRWKNATSRTEKFSDYMKREEAKKEKTDE
ncbi:unnamed protein product, partial [Mesorhabditis spiculigera]